MKCSTVILRKCDDFLDIEELCAPYIVQNDLLKRIIAIDNGMIDVQSLRRLTAAAEEKVDNGNEMPSSVSPPPQLLSTITETITSETSWMKTLQVPITPWNNPHRVFTETLQVPTSAVVTSTVVKTFTVEPSRTPKKPTK